MRAFFILSIVLIATSVVSPLKAADSTMKPALSKNGPAPDLKALQKRRGMTGQEMVKILIAAADESKVLPHRVLLKYRGIELHCIYDEQHDRMRILAPVAARGNVTSDQFEKAMQANFHTALDARYALNKGILYAAFIHPLSLLTKAQVESALHQTAALAATFGREYTSGSLTFRDDSKPL